MTLPINGQIYCVSAASENKKVKSPRRLFRFGTCGIVRHGKKGARVRLTAHVPSADQSGVRELNV
jgi:hypothetical protein